ncbi:hypothetical protein QZH41_010459 [Actinostola sp. cb2023]|nr:hypothetical protein QZH41_010459 [Actinostola sp. cb2023]
MDNRTPKPLKGTKARPAKSCLDILVSSHSKGTRVYWLDPPNTGSPIQGFCDMDTDGGGWTIVKRMILQSTSPPENTTRYSKYEVIAAALDTNKNTMPLGAAMLDILNKMGFHQIHFYCHKKSVGRVVSIMTKNNRAGQQVVHFFTNNTFAKTTFPDACGSFDRLPEDTSILAQNCDKWGKDSSEQVQVDKWSYYRKNGAGRLSNRPIAMHGATIHGFSNFKEFMCDDSFNSPQPFNAKDTWRVSVR